jgi:signal transduction histidine kinase/CheY-like chemotaxis protein
MTDELKTLYDTLLSRNDDLRQEVDVREHAEMELKKHRDHLEDLVEKRTLDLASARDAALDASRSKSLFLANMSHELRTPLNAIIGYSEMMMEDIVGTDAQDNLGDLEKVHLAGRHLLALINDILDLTKIEAGKMDLYEEWFDVSEMLRVIVDTIQPLYAKNRNTIEVHCPENIGDLYADLTKIRQSLFNLLSNAGKFSPGGEIVLSVRREILSGHEQISFSVKDSGIGMSQAQQDRLFEAFSQADASTTRKFGGTGLGLVISQHFCNMMGGDINIVSAQGQGSTFTITLPVKKGPQLPLEDNSNVTKIAWHAGAVAEGKRFVARKVSGDDERREKVSSVLVIDDDPSVRKIMSYFLSQKGFDVHTAVSGEEGLSIAGEIKPDVITLDVMMPGQDGWSVLKTLKQNSELCEIPVILITMVENRGLGYSLGAVEYMSKPIDKDRLHNVISRCVRHQSHGPLLIVEDDEDMRNSMQDILRVDGWDVDAVASAESAFSSVGNNPPALILLDMLMPTMNGFEFLEQLRHNPRWRNIPVIVVTGQELSTDELQQLQAQSASVVNKAAYEHDELLREIHDRVAQSLSPQRDRLNSAVSAD